ncbi:UNVERIFIED_CONTAM: hypothetical protein RMT77_013277 [Armadillidium vulgare]
MEAHGRKCGRALRRKRLVRSDNVFEAPPSTLNGWNSIIRESLLHIALPVNISLENSVYDRTCFGIRCRLE